MMVRLWCVYLKETIMVRLKCIGIRVKFSGINVAMVKVMCHENGKVK